MSVAEATETTAGGQDLDPYAVYPGVESCIRGLGGETRGPDRKYAFHSPYVEAAKGHCAFRIAFDGLRGTEGTLTVRLHMQPADGSAIARLINSERIPVAQLIERGGVLTLGFESFPGMAYAVYGLIFDQTNAAADGLRITLDRPKLEGEEEGAARATNYGSTNLLTTIRLASTDMPNLREPVSQIYTPEQLDRSALARARQLGLSAKKGDETWLWEQLHILSALGSYGLMAPGARGLLIEPGADAGAVPAALVSAGASLVAAGEELPDLQQLHWPAACDPARMDGMVSAVAAPVMAIPTELRGFDFLWSNHVVDRFEDGKSALIWLEDSLNCLHSGGFGIHSFMLADKDGFGGVLDRMLMERLTLTLISRGHQVAQLKMWDRPSRHSVGPVPFVLLTRRG
jgi:hypothetical protein